MKSRLKIFQLMGEGGRGGGGGGGGNRLYPVYLLHSCGKLPHPFFSGGLIHTFVILFDRFQFEKLKNLFHPNFDAKFIHPFFSGA